MTMTIALFHSITACVALGMILNGTRHLYTVAASVRYLAHLFEFEAL